MGVGLVDGGGVQWKHWTAMREGCAVKVGCAAREGCAVKAGCGRDTAPHSVPAPTELIEQRRYWGKKKRWTWKG